MGSGSKEPARSSASLALGRRQPVWGTQRGCVTGRQHPSSSEVPRSPLLPEESGTLARPQTCSTIRGLLCGSRQHMAGLETENARQPHPPQAACLLDTQHGSWPDTPGTGPRCRATHCEPCPVRSQEGPLSSVKRMLDCAPRLFDVSLLGAFIHCGDTDLPFHTQVCLCLLHRL